MSYLHRLRKDEIVYKLANYFTILTVRHPLARLESFFVNKKIDTERIAEKHEEGVEAFYESQMGESFQKVLDGLVSKEVKDLNQHFAPYTTKLAKECTIPFK